VIEGSLVVVKVGGSLLAEGRLPKLLHALASWREARIVIVPGGGVFADAVRSAQASAGFDDSIAHRLALDAMAQMAAVFRACEPRLAILEDTAAVDVAHASGQVPVWSPVMLKEGHPEVPESWRVTSDSLALWLARAIGADRAMIIKSVDPAEDADIATLSAQGILDEVFPAFASRFAGAIDILGPRKSRELFPALRGSRSAAA
jgi:aspartokinase-like uncharacterized kinase